MSVIHWCLLESAHNLLPYFLQCSIDCSGKIFHCKTTLPYCCESYDIIEAIFFITYKEIIQNIYHLVHIFTLRPFVPLNVHTSLMFTPCLWQLSSYNYIEKFYIVLMVFTVTCKVFFKIFQADFQLEIRALILIILWRSPYFILSDRKRPFNFSCNLYLFSCCPVIFCILFNIVSNPLWMFNSFLISKFISFKFISIVYSFMVRFFYYDADHIRPDYHTITYFLYTWFISESHIIINRFLK